MADIDDYQTWINDTKKYLGMGGGKGTMEKRNNEIAALLKDPDLVTSNIYKDKYEDLATRAFNIKNGASKNPRAAIKEISGELRLLKKQVRLAKGAKDPVSNPKARKEVLKAVREEPFYREKRERVIKTLDAIKALPGTQVEVLSLEQMLNQADECEPDYKRALAKLTLFSDLNVREGEGLRLHLEDAQKSSKKFADTAGGPEFQKKLQKARETVGDYEEVAGVSDRRGIAEARNSVNAALKLLDGKTPDQDGAIKALDAVITTYGGKVKTLSGIQKDLKTMVNEVTETVRSLIDAAPADAIAELRAQHRTARALWENQQFEAAKTAWDNLKIEADKAWLKHEKDYTKWQGYEKQIQAKADKLAEALDTPALQPAANYLQSLIKRNLEAELIPLHKFSDACLLVESENIVVSLKELADQVPPKGDVKFGNAQLNFRAATAKHQAAIDKKFLLISAEMEKLAKVKGDIGPFQKDVDDIRREWTKRVSGLSVQNDEAGLGQLALAAIANAEDVLKEIVDLQQNPVDLGKSQTQQVKNAQAPAFEEERKKAEGAIRRLTEFNLPDSAKRLKDSPDFKGIRTDYQAFVDDAEKGNYAVDKMAKLESDCENKRKLIEGDLKSMRDRAAQTASEFNARIDKEEKAHKEYANFYAAIREQIDDYLGQTRSSLITQIEKGLSDLTILATAKLPDGGDFDKVEEKLKSLTKLVGSSDLTAYQPEAQAVFDKRLKTELKANVYKLSPAEALKSITEFETEVKKSADRADSLKKLRGEVIKRAKLLNGKLEEIKGDAKNLYDRLSARLSKVSTPGKGDVDAANLEISSLEVLLKSAKIPGALAKLEKKAELDLFEDQRQKASFESSLDVFTFGIKVDAKNLYESIAAEERNKDVYTQIANIEKQAREIVKSGNYAAANEELLRAVNMAKYFMNNPTDRASASRKELERFNEEYKAAVSEYLKQLADLKAQLGDAEEDDGSGGIQKVDGSGAIKAIEPLFSLFSAGAYDKQVEVLEKPAATLQELNLHRKHQELARRNISVSEKALAGNKLLAHVTANPIKPVSVVRIKTSLRGLMTAVLAS